MKKAELLKMPNLLAVQEMFRAAREDKPRIERERYRDFYGNIRTITRSCYQYYLYFRACEERGILKVSVFVREWLMQGRQRPQFEIYLSKEEQRFLTYDTEHGKWREAKIDMLDFDRGEGYSWLYASRNWQSDTTRKLVNDYLGTGNLDVKEAVLGFQYQIREEKLDKKHRTETEAIDAVMNEVPELPKDFERWVLRNCFQEYILYRKKGREYEAYCTHCGRWRMLTCNPVHNGTLYCKTCEEFYLGKAWGKQKYLTEEQDVGVLQRLQDGTGYILRNMVCRIKRTRETGWETPELHIYEDRRVRLTRSFIEEEFFEYGEYKRTGVVRWCHTIKGGVYGYYASRRFGRAYMYTPNLKRELKDQTFVHIDLKRIMRGGERKRVDPAYILRRLRRYPFIEYLLKSGLETLTKELMEGKENENMFIPEADRLTTALKLDKPGLRRLKACNGGCNVLAALQEECISGSRVTDENLQYIQMNEINLGELERQRTGMSLQRTLNYLKRQQEQEGMEFVTLIRYYRDYLDMAEERGMDLRDEIVCHNSRMMQYHNRYLEEKNAMDARKRDMEVNQKYPGIRTGYDTNRKHFFWKDNEYIIQVPRMASDITKEGRIQHHCVGTGGFMKKMHERTTFILFLRHRQEPDIPWYTLEVTWDGRIVQRYGAFDRLPEVEKVDQILKKWQKEIQNRILKETKQQEAVLQYA